MKKISTLKCIILANGKAPSKRLVSHFQNQNKYDLICADGGANSARRLNLLPIYIIGDFDSIKNSTSKYFSHSSKLINLKRQSDTDVEKCLKFAIKNGYSDALLMGVTGNRLDHTFNNLGIALKYFSKINISIVSENSFLKVFKNSVSLKSIPNETISIYGIDRRTRITSIGLKYPLTKSPLAFGIKDGTSNQSTSSKVILSISGGAVFVIRDINFMIRHDLI